GPFRGLPDRAAPCGRAAGSPVAPRGSGDHVRPTVLSFAQRLCGPVCLAIQVRPYACSRRSKAMGPMCLLDYRACVAIQVQGHAFAYPGGDTLFESVSFRVATGECTGL